MLRNILVLFPALALALPLVSAQPASAGPLTAQAVEVDFGKGTKPDKPTGEADADFELVLALCTTVQILVENRACELERRDDGAAVCDTRFKPGKLPGKKPGKEPTKPQDEDEAGGLIFVNIEQCMALGINIENR